LQIKYPTPCRGKKGDQKGDKAGRQSWKTRRQRQKHFGNQVPQAVGGKKKDEAGRRGGSGRSILATSYCTPSGGRQEGRQSWETKLGDKAAAAETCWQSVTQVVGDKKGDKAGSMEGGSGGSILEIRHPVIEK